MACLARRKLPFTFTAITWSQVTFGHVGGERPDWPGDTGTAEHGVQAAEDLDDSGDRRDDLALDGEVRLDELDGMTLLPQGVDHRPAGGAAVEHRDTGTLAEQGVDTGTPDTGGTAGDEGDTVTKMEVHRRGSCRVRSAQTGGRETVTR